jgi:hypothetical protein
MDALESNISVKSIFGKIIVEDPERIEFSYTRYESTVHKLYDNLDRMSNVKLIPELKSEEKLQQYLLKRFKEYKKIIKPKLYFKNNSSNLIKLKSWSHTIDQDSNVPNVWKSRTLMSLKSPTRLNTREDTQSKLEQLTTPNKQRIRQIIPSTLDPLLGKISQSGFNLRTERAKFFKSVLDKSPMKINTKKSILSNILKGKRNELPMIDTNTIYKDYPHTERINKFTGFIHKEIHYKN